MTCCVGLRYKYKNGRKGVYLAADSSICTDSEVVPMSTDKIFTIGSYDFAHAGSFRLAQIIRYCFEPTEPPVDEDIVKFMASTFISELTLALKDNLPSKNIDEPLELELLVVVSGRLFYIGSDLCIVENKDDFAAIGAARKYALGSLYATVGLEPEERVTMALEAASHFSPWSIPPFTIAKIRN